jgi:hypothetical protein
MTGRRSKTLDRKIEITPKMIEAGVGYVRAEWDFSDQLLREMSECDLADILRVLGFDIVGEGEEIAP